MKGELGFSKRADAFEEELERALASEGDADVVEEEEARWVEG